MKKLKIGIIGVGNISSAHIDGYLKNPHCELYALCDTDECTLAKKGAKYNISRLFSDHKTMLKSLPELDAVSVCTSNIAHAECTIDCLRAGKHVFCEKPMALNAEQALKMKAEAEKAQKTLGIGFVRRYGKDAELARELVGDGKTGELYYTKSSYIRRNGNPGGWFADRSLSGGGPLIDLGVHIIDLVRYIADNPKPVSVYGATFTKLCDRRNLKDTKIYLSESEDNRVCDVEDLAAAMIRFENGFGHELQPERGGRQRKNGNFRHERRHKNRSRTLLLYRIRRSACKYKFSVPSDFRRFGVRPRDRRFRQRRFNGTGDARNRRRRRADHAHFRRDLRIRAHRTRNYFALICHKKTPSNGRFY